MERKVYIIGDSHSLEFTNFKNSAIHHIGPTTMHRIGRDGLSILDFRTFNVQENDVVVLTFGEIDVRCHIGKQRDGGRDLDEVIDTLLKNYFQTILINKSFYQNLTVLVYTVTPPTDQRINPEFMIYGSIADRVHITKKLNQKLIKMASEYGIDAIDVFDQFADAEGKLVPELSDRCVHISPKCNQPVLDALADRLKNS
jgi:hypothetical protein